MKLVRYGAPGREKPGIIDADGKIRDLSRVVKDIDGEMLSSGGLAKIKKANIKRLKAVGGKPRLGACIGNVRNFIAIGPTSFRPRRRSRNADPERAAEIFNKAPEFDLPDRTTTPWCRRSPASLTGNANSAS